MEEDLFPIIDNMDTFNVFNEWDLIWGLFCLKYRIGEGSITE